MTTKRITILILVIIVLGVLGFAGYKITDGISQKRAEEQAAREYHIAGNYGIQNKTFYDIGKEKYIPYTKEYEYELQISINCYTRNTGKTITLGDVETFLASSENSDGTPRTWEDDETGIVKDFVEWGAWNRDTIKKYRIDIDRILGQYIRLHPECPYNTLSDLMPEQINMLDKKYADSDYELSLE